MPNVQPKWRIEPVIQFIVYYYANNTNSATPINSNNILRTYEDAINLAKETILTNNNSGVCVISQMAGSIVYPAQFFEEF